MFSHRERHGRALWGGSVLKPFNLPRTLRSARYQTTGRGHWQTFAPPLPPDAAQRACRKTSYQPAFPTNSSFSVVHF